MSSTMPDHPNYLKTPTIGRDVHYVARGSADGKFPPVHRAAKITEVDSYGLGRPAVVSLFVMNPQGCYFDTGMVQDEVDKAPGTWHWPEMVD